MNNRDNNKPRKAHNINSQINEEDLWDLENDWNDDTATASDLIEQDSSLTEKSDEASEPKPASTENSKDAEAEPDSQPRVKSETPSDSQEDEISDSDIAAVEESGASPDDTEPSGESKSAIEGEGLISPLKKFSLSSTEKITLAALTIVLIGLGIWGYVFLYQKNNLADKEASLSLPVKGEYATVTELSTYWISAGKAAGIKLGVAVVPVAKITLDNDSSSGALRVFFRDAEKTRVGDPITISFQDGKFDDPNQTNITITDSGATATVSATNGFKIESDFNAYQMDSTLTWRVHVLEAKASSAAGSKFEELFNTGVEPKRR